MNILYISNYDAHRRIAEGWMPSHHLFGVMELIESFDSKSSAIIKKKYGGGKIDFISLEKPSKFDIMKVYFMTIGGQYDIVYDVLNVVSKYFSVLNKWNLFSPRLVSIYHHPPFRKYMVYGKSDCSVFFTKELMNEAKKYTKDDREIVFNNWYPDKEWYDQNMPMLTTMKKYDFLDNGKSERNHNLFIRCMRTMPDKKAIIVTDKNHIPTEWEDGENVDLYFQDTPNDYTMEQLCLESRVMVIPLEEKVGKLMGPLGNTSYMDAIALGMPVVTNRNAVYAKEIIENGLGVVFDSTVESMRTALVESLDNYSDYTERMIQFSRNHSIVEYSKKLLTYIFE